MSTHVLHEEYGLMLRVCGEFRDISGVSLNARQAGRLFGMSEDMCERLLISMVERGLLDVTVDGGYRYRTHPKPTALES